MTERRAAVPRARGVVTTSWRRGDDTAEPSPRLVDAYLDAVTWLAQHNLGAAALVPECRELWRRGGADRLLAESLVGRWTA